MANAKSKVSSKTTTKRKTPTTEQLAGVGRLALAAVAATDEREARQAEADKRIRRDELDGIALKGKRLEQARDLLSDMNMAALSVHELAKSALCASDIYEAGPFLTAIENSAMLICRKADVVAALLGDTGFGNFADEFEALTPARAAELELEEQESEAIA